MGDVNGDRLVTRLHVRLVFRFVAMRIPDAKLLLVGVRHNSPTKHFWCEL